MKRKAWFQKDFGACESFQWKWIKLKYKGVHGLKSDISFSNILIF